ncbi:MAG: DUF58 domain-containing protein, partial [Polyangiaceae bacterium]
MVPTRRLVVLAFAAALLATGAGLVPSLRSTLATVDAVLVVAALVDALFATGRAPRVEVLREAAAIFSVGRANQVTLRLRNRSKRRLRGIVADDLLLDSSADGNPAPFDLAPLGRTAVRYEVTPARRGARAFDGVTVRYASPLGLVARQERTRLPAKLDVLPDVHAARSLELLRRQGRQDARIGSLRALGGETEFERLRPYQRGDTMRHVDWRASARRDDLTVRQYQTESNQNVVF